MIEKAIEKIKSEMNQNKTQYIKLVGEYLLKQIEINKDAAIAIVKDNKTISGAVIEIASVAKKNAIKGPSGLGTVGCVTDNEGFEIVRKYFGFEAVQDRMIDVDVHEIKSDACIEEKKVSSADIDFDIKIEDLMNS
ncbi:hypothetical protein [Clostridium butyricum]